MRFINRLQHVLTAFHEDEALYLRKEILAALVSGYILSDRELRMWNELGLRLGGKR